MCNQRVPLSGFPISAPVCSRLKPNDYSSIVSLSVGAAGVLVGHPFDTVKVGNNNVIAIFFPFFFSSPPLSLLACFKSEISCL